MEQKNRQRLNYHLRKTQPFKAQSKKTVTSQMRLYQRPQKVSIIHKKNVLSFMKVRDQRINQEHLNDNITNAASRMNIRKSDVRPSIFHRSGSECKIQKLNVAQRGKSLKYWKNSVPQPKIMKTLKGFFNQLMSNQDGCKCGPDCQVSQMLLAWVDVPENLIKSNYNRLLQKVSSHIKFGEQKQSETQWSDYDEEETSYLYDEQQKLFKQIKKDIVRTQSTSQAFKNPIVQKKGERLLMCYTFEDPELGYIQGMNMVMSGILYHVRDEAKSYAVSRKIFHEIRQIYLQNFEQSYFHINRVIQLIADNINDLYDHLKQMNVEFKIVLFPWILSLLSSIIPLDYLHLVYQGFIKCGGWKFIYRMILSIFVYHKNNLKQMCDGSDILIFLSSSNEQKNTSDWQDIYKYALTIKI